MDFPVVYADNLIVAIGVAMDVDTLQERALYGRACLLEAPYGTSARDIQRYEDGLIAPFSRLERRWLSIGVPVVVIDDFEHFLSEAKSFEGCLILSHGQDNRLVPHPMDAAWIQFGKDWVRADELSAALGESNLKLVDFISCVGIRTASLIRSETGVYAIGMDVVLSATVAEALIDPVAIEMQESKCDYFTARARIVMATYDELNGDPAAIALQEIQIQ